MEIKNIRSHLLKQKLLRLWEWTRLLPYRLCMNSDRLKKSGNDAIAIHAKGKY
ncbi:hypothetical protein [Nostoc sp.]|uniref:hypothetical protein n=1 Tax=Nostoc sp. TaxID=1180 RepID=UPI002FF7C965